MAEAALRRSALEGRRILVVEDEYFLADDIGSALSAHGATVIGPVATLAKAFEAIETGVDAAVLDINLRGNAIWPVAAALRTRHVPIVLATGYGPEKMPAAYADVGRCVKPVELNRLLSVLVDAIEKPL